MAKGCKEKEEAEEKREGKEERIKERETIRGERRYIIGICL